MLDASVARADDPFVGIDSYIEAALKRWEIPGLAIAIVKDGEVVLARGYGLCEIGGDRKVTPDTAFDIASCGKSFVATSVALLVEQGKLSWDDSVAKHLQGFELADPYLTEHVTLRDLLCHRTGLRRADLLGDAGALEPLEVLGHLRYLEPIAGFRAKYIYNNHMYTVLTEVIATASGKPYRQFVSERIFEPLQMRSTTYNVADFSLDRIARRHWRSDAGVVARPAGAGLFSSVCDMAHWMQLQLSEGVYAGRRLLEPGTIREMQALQFSVPIKSRPSANIYAAQFYGSGLGWQIQDYRGLKVVSHGGSWGAKVALMPKMRLGVVVLSNLDLEHLASLLTYDVCDAYLDGPEVSWDPDKWDRGWIRVEPPGNAYRPRDQAKAQLQESRKTDTVPSLPLKEYAGSFESKLYGQLVVRREGGKLYLTVGEFTTEMSHWEHDSFYVRSPTKLTYDWLLTFDLSGKDQAAKVIVKHVGWDTDEMDHVYLRRP